MILFIALPLVSVVTQSIYAPHPAVLIEVENCTPLVGCTTETTGRSGSDRGACARLKSRLAGLWGLEIYF